MQRELNGARVAVDHAGRRNQQRIRILGILACQQNASFTTAQGRTPRNQLTREQRSARDSATEDHATRQAGCRLAIVFLLLLVLATRGEVEIGEVAQARGVGRARSRLRVRAGLRCLLLLLSAPAAALLFVLVAGHTNGRRRGSVARHQAASAAQRAELMAGQHRHCVPQAARREG